MPALALISPAWFRSYRLHRQLVAFQKRFRLLKFPLAGIRPEFDRNASDAGMLAPGRPDTHWTRPLLPNSSGSAIG